MKTWVIINETDDYIICRGISKDYHKAVGILYTRFTDVINDWINNNYKLLEKSEWCELEASSGYGFYAKLEHVTDNGYKITINENWYLLEYEEEKQ